MKSTEFEGTFEVASDSLWEKVLEDLKAKVSRQSFETWYKPARLLSFEGEACKLELPNKFFKEWFAEHHLPMLRESIAAITVALRITSG